MNGTFSRFCIHRAESPIVAASGCPSTSFSPAPSAAVFAFSCFEDFAIRANTPCWQLFRCQARCPAQVRLVVQVNRDLLSASRRRTVFESPRSVFCVCERWQGRVPLWRRVHLQTTYSKAFVGSRIPCRESGSLWVPRQTDGIVNGELGVNQDGLAPPLLFGSAILIRADPRGGSIGRDSGGVPSDR